MILYISGVNINNNSKLFMIVGKAGFTNMKPFEFTSYVLDVGTKEDRTRGVNEKYLQMLDELLEGGFKIRKVKG